jgi:MFS family permease
MKTTSNVGAIPRFRESEIKPEHVPTKLDRLVGDLQVNGSDFAIILFLQFLTYGVFGTENSLVPLMASDNFHVPGASKTLVVLVMYGIFKAVAGLIVAPLNGVIGRHNVHRVGWLLFIPNPFMIWYAENWDTIIAAYAFLGFSQGFCSCTDNQFVQQLIPNSQGFAVGVYETTSYISLAIFGVIAAGIATNTGSNRPGPQQLALGMTLLALLVTTRMPKQDNAKEAKQDKAYDKNVVKKSFFRIFAETTILHRVPAVSCFAGVMIQVAVGLAWTLLPLYFKSLGLKDKVVLASIASTFNAIRGVFQLFSGTLSDFLGARIVVASGFLLCGLSFILSAAIPAANPAVSNNRGVKGVALFKGLVCVWSRYCRMYCSALCIDATTIFDFTVGGVRCAVGTRCWISLPCDAGPSGEGSAFARSRYCNLHFSLLARAGLCPWGWYFRLDFDTGVRRNLCDYHWRSDVGYSACCCYLLWSRDNDWQI